MCDLSLFPQEALFILDLSFWGFPLLAGVQNINGQFSLTWLKKNSRAISEATWPLTIFLFLTACQKHLQEASFRLISTLFVCVCVCKKGSPSPYRFVRYILGTSGQTTMYGQRNITIESMLCSTSPQCTRAYKNPLQRPLDNEREFHSFWWPTS